MYFLFTHFQTKTIYHSVYRYVTYTAIIFLAVSAYKYRSLEMSNPFFITFGYSLIPLIFGFVLLKSIINTNVIITYITSNKVLRFCGRISYGLYIFHWPVYLAGFAVWNKLFKTNPNILPHLHIINVMCTIIVTFTTAYFSFKYFESYFLKLKQYK